jgi:hypothetical protein
MCVAVYIAADQPLILVPWDEAHPAFYLARVDPSDLPVISQFSKANVAYAGSHEGCGCGFQYGEYPEFREPDEAVARRASLDQFAAYLADELTRVGPIELYACWEGDQAATVEHRRALTPMDLMTEEFFFLQKELSLVTAAP